MKTVELKSKEYKFDDMIIVTMTNPAFKVQEIYCRQPHQNDLTFSCGVQAPGFDDQDIEKLHDNGYFDSFISTLTREQFEKAVRDYEQSKHDET